MTRHIDSKIAIQTAATAPASIVNEITVSSPASHPSLANILLRPFRRAQIARHIVRRPQSHQRLRLRARARAPHQIAREITEPKCEVVGGIDQDVILLGIDPQGSARLHAIGAILDHESRAPAVTRLNCSS